MMPEYKVITTRRVYDEHYMKESNWSEKLYEEQEEKCGKLGIDMSYFADEVPCHFFKCAFFNDRTDRRNVYAAIDCLAIKDGVDLVQFDNGNYGFVAYYNGNANGFEIKHSKRNGVLA